ncbi:MAG: RNA polymerase sigma factor [Bacteroidota bacterium]
MFFKKKRQSIDNDADWIQSIRSGGVRRRRGINSLFDHFSYLVKVGIKKYRLREDESLSAYNQSIIVVVDNIISEKFRVDSSIKTYLNQIFSRHCVNIVRANTTQKAGNWLVDLDRFPEPAQDLFNEIVSREEWQIVIKCIDQLKKQCQKILLGAVYEGYSSEELAVQLNLKNAATVNVLKNRCRKSLMKIVANSGLKL